MIFPLDDLNLLKSTLLDHYSYNWPVKDPETGRIKITQALSLGLGSIFNHSDHQNVGFQRDLESKTIVYKPLREVLAGEELCISDASHLWFDNADGENGKAKDIEKESSLLEAVQLYSHSSDSLS